MGIDNLFSLAGDAGVGLVSRTGTVDQGPFVVHDTCHFMWPQSDLLNSTMCQELLDCFF